MSSRSSRDSSGKLGSVNMRPFKNSMICLQYNMRDAIRRTVSREHHYLDIGRILLVLEHRYLPTRQELYIPSRRHEPFYLTAFQVVSSVTHTSSPYCP
jgi:hypothetical protein